MPFDVPLEPLSDRFGFDRGTPLDRRYIDVFLSERRERIRGSVLEVEDNAYTMTFGAGRVVTSTVVMSRPKMSRAQSSGSARREQAASPSHVTGRIRVGVAVHPRNANCKRRGRPGRADVVAPG